MSKIIEDLLYSESHEWVRLEDDIAVIGITDLAQEELGDITYADLPSVDDDFVAGESIGAMESVKASSDIYTPVSGKVVEVNDSVIDDPALINEDAYENWLIKIKITEVSDLDKMMNAEQYKAMYEK